MKFMIFSLGMFLMLIQAVEANQCKNIGFREENFCIIAGGGADTTKTLNLGHARSLSLRNARILAYEKMAERLEGVILGSKSSLKSDLLSEGEVKTIVKATLKNVSIQKEAVSFLSDGSPWAEVTLSVPKRGKLGVETKVLEYSNGTKIEEQENTSIVIDLRDFDYKKSHFFSLYNGEKEVFKFNNFIGNVPKFTSKLQIDNQSKIKLIKPLKVKGSDITITEDDSKFLVMENYTKEIIKNKKLLFLTK
jgi:hypothetical protein